MRRKFKCDLIITQTDSRTHTVSVKDEQYHDTVPHALRVMSSFVRSFEDELEEIAKALEENRIEDYITKLRTYTPQGEA